MEWQQSLCDLHSVNEEIPVETADVWADQGLAAYKCLFTVACLPLHKRYFIDVQCSVDIFVVNLALLCLAPPSYTEFVCFVLENVDGKTLNEINES